MCRFPLKSPASSQGNGTVKNGFSKVLLQNIMSDREEIRFGRTNVGGDDLRQFPCNSIERFIRQSLRFKIIELRKPLD